jgi:hypothetical protein
MSRGRIGISRCSPAVPRRLPNRELQLIKNLAIAIASLALGSCTRPYRDPCVSAGKPGNRLSALLLEPYDADSKLALYGGDQPLVIGDRPSCGSFDGLTVDSTVEITVGRERYGLPTGDTGCWLYSGEGVPPPGWSFGTSQDFFPFAPGYNVAISSNEVTYLITYTERTASTTGCSGTWMLALQNSGQGGPSADVFAAPTPDHLPPVTVSRIFGADSAQSCPLLPDSGNGHGPFCGDTWIAQLSCLGGPCASNVR